MREYNSLQINFDFIPRLWTNTFHAEQTFDNNIIFSLARPWKCAVGDRTDTGGAVAWRIWPRVILIQLSFWAQPLAGWGISAWPEAIFYHWWAKWFSCCAGSSKNQQLEGHMILSNHVISNEADTFPRPVEAPLTSHAHQVNVMILKIILKILKI